jgi:hypothetical protein
MTGIEYIVYFAQEPSLFVIQRQNRLSPQLAEHQQTYYVINGTIFQAPTLGAVLSSRILKSLHYARRALRSVEQHSAFSTTRGYSWDHVDHGDTASNRLTDAAQRTAALKTARSAHATPFNITHLFQRVERIQASTDTIVAQAAAAATAAAEAAAAAAEAATAETTAAANDDDDGATIDGDKKRRKKADS